MHLDINSLKHIGVCALGSFLGTHGAAVVMGAAICKEWMDKKSYGHWCWLDLLFDFLGCAVGIGIHLWIFKSWNF